MLCRKALIWYGLAVILFSCRSSGDCVSETKVVSLEKTLSLLAQGHFGPLTTPYLDSLGQELNIELKALYNSNQLTGDYYLDCDDVPSEVRLKVLRDHDIIYECLKRLHKEIAVEPIPMKPIGCDTIMPYLIQAFDRDQAVRKGDVQPLI